MYKLIILYFCILLLSLKTVLFKIYLRFIYFQYKYFEQINLNNKKFQYLNVYHIARYSKNIS